MNTIHNIEGTLKKVEILAKRPGEDKALVSRVTIDTGSYITTVPYYGPITESEAEYMRAFSVRFLEQEKGWALSKRFTKNWMVEDTISE